LSYDPYGVRRACRHEVQRRTHTSVDGRMPRALRRVYGRRDSSGKPRVPRGAPRRTSTTGANDTGFAGLRVHIRDLERTDGGRSLAQRLEYVYQMRAAVMVSAIPFGISGLAIVALTRRRSLVLDRQAWANRRDIRGGCRFRRRHSQLQSTDGRGELTGSHRRRLRNV
jgi:hypothetical protein